MVAEKDNIISSDFFDFFFLDPISTIDENLSEKKSWINKYNIYKNKEKKVFLKCFHFHVSFM